MSSLDSRIFHVSDTALMTAACRALETERPDGWMKDPYAARLAGERGMAILRGLTGMEMMSFGIGMRTRILDEWILSVIRENGIASVLSVGAGLDSRPWRLKLPSDLLWTEVDLQPMLDYKRAVLAEDQPRCRLKRMAVDLNDTSQRATLYGAAGGGPTLLITEGLLMYLPAATVQSLASETAAASEICCWMMDATTSTLRRSISTATFKDIDAMRAADHLTCEEILAVVALAGWHPAESRTYRVYGMEVMPPARRHTMARMAAESGVPTAPPPPIDDRSGVHLFTRPAA